MVQVTQLMELINHPKREVLNLRWELNLKKFTWKDDFIDSN